MILEAVGRGVSRAPALFVVSIVLLSILFGYFASQTEMESEEEDFNPDSEIARASERVSDYFGPGVKTVQVIARDRDGGDVLTRDALMEVLELEERILVPSEGRNITDTIQPTESVPTGVQSIAGLVAFGAMLQEGNGQFEVQMANLSGSLGQMSQTLTDLAQNVSTMNMSDPEDVGSTLFLLNATLAQLWQGLAQVGGQMGGQQQNGNLVPNLTTVRHVLEGLEDQGVKGLVSWMYAFDPAPLEGHVMEVVTRRETILHVTEREMDAPLTGQLLGLNADPSFMAGNYTFMGMPVNVSELLHFSLTFLDDITASTSLITGFEAQPKVLETQVRGVYQGLKATLTEDFDPLAAQPRAKASLMIVQQNGSKSSQRLLESQYELEEMADGVGDGIEFMVMGNEIMFDKINTSSMETLGVLLGLSIVFIIVILALVYRSLTDTAFTLIALMLVITWTFGIGVMLGYTFNPLTTAVPILLVGLSVDYGIHLTMRNRLEKRSSSLRRAVIATIASVGMALLLATVTTVFSFLSNILSSLEVMRQFGILTAVGIICAFIIMNTFVPSCRLLLDRRRERLGKRRGTSQGGRKGPRREGRLVRFVELGAHGAARASVPIIAVSVVLSGVSFYTLTQIESEFDFMDFLPEDLPETETINYLVDEFNFSATTSSVLLEGNVADDQVLKGIDEVQRAMANDRDVVKVGAEAQVTSPLTVIHRYSQEASPQYVPALATAFEQSDTDDDGVPDTDVKDLLDQFYDHPLAGREMLSVLFRNAYGEYEAAIIRVGVHEEKDGGELLSEQLNEDIDELEDLKGDGVLKEVIVTDGPVLTYSVVTEFNEAGLKSVLITIVAAALLLTIAFWIAFRTVVVGLLTTIPIVLVVGWVFGSMFLLGIPLNVVTITVAALTIGLGITYAIHISHRFLEDVEKEPWEAAMCTTVGHTGAALFGAAATTIGGFGILSFSILPPLAQFGIVTALSILFSFLASVFVLPSFLAIWARRRYGTHGEMCAIDDAEVEGAEAVEDGAGEEGEVPEAPDEAME